MTEDMKTYEETVEWKDANNAVLKFTHVTPVKDGKDMKKVMGTQSRILTADVTYEDLQGQLDNQLRTKENLLSQVRQHENKIEALEAELKKKGISKVKTGEMIRIEKALSGIRLLEQLNNERNQAEDLKKRACEGDDFIGARTASLSKRPKDEVEVKDE